MYEKEESCQSDSSSFWTRRQLLRWSLTGLGITGIAAALLPILRSKSNLPVRIPRTTNEKLSADYLGFDPINVLREFNYGRIKHENGKVIREFEIIADHTSTKLNNEVSFVSWNFNNRVPGSTLRAVEGDRIRVIFRNQDGHRHSIHFHGIHPAEMDGITPIGLGKETIYEFDAKPYGIHLYHCHISPVNRHISKGLYGMFIVDPPKKRPPADEIVLIMGGYDINEDLLSNEIYAFNGLPNYYKKYPISIYQNQLVRLYLLNMIEYDAAVTFHIHANMFKVFPTGRSIKPMLETDVITMGTAERHILEFSYPYPGEYMFHPHQDKIAENGCMGIFSVIPSSKYPSN
ncbi:MAG: multicopper oxidase domain-containing protein [Cyanobacteria bacterium P01_G01_bin.49]